MVEISDLRFECWKIIFASVRVDGRTMESRIWRDGHDLIDWSPLEV